VAGSVVRVMIFRPAAKLVTQEDVLDPFSLQDGGEFVDTSPGGVARMGPGSHVGYDLDAMGGEQR
jgi:hypothetical protein